MHQPTLFDVDQFNARPVRFHQIEIGQRFRIAHYHAAEQRYSRGETIYEKISDEQARATQGNPPYATLTKHITATQQVFIVYGANND